MRATPAASERGRAGRKEGRLRAVAAVRAAVATGWASRAAAAWAATRAAAARVAAAVAVAVAVAMNEGGEAWEASESVGGKKTLLQIRKGPAAQQSTKSRLHLLRRRTCPAPGIHPHARSRTRLDTIAYALRNWSRHTLFMQRIRPLLNWHDTRPSPLCRNSLETAMPSKEAEASLVITPSEVRLKTGDDAPAAKGGAPAKKVAGQSLETQQVKAEMETDTGLRQRSIIRSRTFKPNTCAAARPHAHDQEIGLFRSVVCSDRPPHRNRRYHHSQHGDGTVEVSERNVALVVSSRSPRSLASHCRKPIPTPPTPTTSHTHSPTSPLSPHRALALRPCSRFRCLVQWVP